MKVERRVVSLTSILPYFSLSTLKVKRGVVSFTEHSVNCFSLSTLEVKRGVVSFTEHSVNCFSLSTLKVKRGVVSLIQHSNTLVLAL